MAGALVGGALGAFGKKPKIPELPQIDPSQIQAQTLAGNQKALPAAQALGSAVNAFNTDQLRAILGKLLPGQLDQAESIVRSELRGELPSDVQSLLTRQGAAQSLGLGLGGTGVQAATTARSMGLTSLQLQQQGLGNFRQLASTAPPPFDVTSMFFNPQQRLAFAFQDRTARFNRDLLNAQVEAAPNPADVALAEGLDNLFATFASIGIGMLGGGGGQMTTQGNPGLQQNFGGGNGTPGYLGSSGGAQYYQVPTSQGGGGGSNGFMGDINVNPSLIGAA